MRLTRYHLFLLGGLFLMVMGPLAFTQPGPGPRGGGKRGNPGDWADRMFNQLSNNQDSFTVANVQIPEGMTRMEPAEKQKEKMLTFLVKKGVNDGKMTKTLYSEFFQERMTEMRAQWGGRAKQGGGGTVVVSPATTPAPGTPSSDPDAAARTAFKFLDKNNDGVLSLEEMQAARETGSRIYKEREKWDTNKNGTIELAEFIEYYKSRNGQSKGNQPTPPPADATKPQEEDIRPVVYRVGKLPKGLPAWFEQLDQDKDGQIGLYEWKESGRSVEQFLALDHNGDGFITVEELLRDQKANAKKGVAGAPSPTIPTLGRPSPGMNTPPSPGQDDSTRGKGRGGNRRRGGNRNQGN